MNDQNSQKFHDQMNLIEVKVWGFVVITVTLILCFIVVALLYSVTFVAQPIKSMAPIDQAYTKMLNDIVLLIVGGIGGVMSRKGVQAISDKMAANQTPPPATVSVAAPAPVTPPAPAIYTSPVPNFNWMGITNPELDETWRPPPPPTTPPDFVDPAKEQIAQERAMAKAEA